MPNAECPWWLDLDDDGQRAGLLVLGHLLDLAERAGLLLEGLGGHLVDHLVHLLAEVAEVALELVGDLALKLAGLLLDLALQLVLEFLAQALADLAGVRADVVPGPAGLLALDLGLLA